MDKLKIALFQTGFDTALNLHSMKNRLQKIPQILKEWPAAIQQRKQSGSFTECIIKL